MICRYCKQSGEDFMKAGLRKSGGGTSQYFKCRPCNALRMDSYRKALPDTKPLIPREKKTVTETEQSDALNAMSNLLSGHPGDIAFDTSKIKPELHLSSTEKYRRCKHTLNSTKQGPDTCRECRSNNQTFLQ